jgi:hypothetical protein
LTDRVLPTPATGQDDTTLMPVHGGNTVQGVVDDHNTTLEEIDGVNIAPQNPARSQ